MAARSHARFARLLAFGVTVGLGTALVSQPAVAAPAQAPVALPDSAPDEASASLVARQANKAVRVDGLTDETTEVVANPDGTFTMTQHARPVRVARAGGWTPVDTTLVERPDGSIGPRAAAVELAVSPGGSGAPLAALGKDGAEVGLVWPDALPRPVLAGPTATYPEVMPGVDLKVTADVAGFSQVLVVKDREAARNPKLRKVAFGTHVENAKVEADKGNGAGRDSDVGPAKQTAGDALKVKDKAGKPVFIGDATRMWDSAGEATAEERLTGSAVDANTAAMDATVSPTGVVIEPDADFLADPDTVYPVYLDPSYTCTSPNCGKAHHAVVQSAWPTARNYNRTDGALSDLKAGYTCNDSPCSISRTYLGMKTASLGGKIIHSAVLNLEVIKSAHCGDAQPTELWRANSINSDFTWNTQAGWREGSGWGAKLSSGNVTNNPTYCPGASGMDLTATAAVVDAAKYGWDVTTFMLKGSNESNDVAWRRFDLNPFLVVKYNTKPNAPTEMGITPSSLTLPCTTGANRSFTNTRTPKLRARVSDPDGGTLSAGFRVFVGPYNNYSGPVVDTVDSSTASGQFAQITVPAGRITAEGVHTWHLWSSDGDVSSWSANCEMHVDTIAPGVPTITSAAYPQGAPGGGVGVAATFTLAPPAGDPHQDIDYYLWGVTDQGGEPAAKANPAQLNAPASISFIAQKSGPQVLTVKAVDRAGNVSAPVTYAFEVADYQVGVSGKVAHWSFADTLADTSGVKTLAYNGMPPEGYFGPGANEVGSGLHLLAEEQAHYQSKGALVRTDRAFTLSAWAMLTSDAQDHVLFAQTGDRAAAVDLRYSRADNAWAVVATGSDTDAPTTIKITAPVALNTWTHLAAVYDPAAGNALRLYVDGVLAGATTLPSGLWNAVKPFVIGSGKAAGKLADYLTGAVDTIRVHDRALDGAGIAALHTGTDAQAPTAEYLLENDLLNSGADFDLAWDAPTTYGTGYDGKSITLSHTVGARPKTARPVINTAGDFSVAAWVKLKDKDRHYGVVSQDGERMAGFLVRYAPDVDRWIFGLADQDTDAGLYHWAIGTSSPQIGEWTHITAVHDATVNKIRLYVNGVLEAERDQNPPSFSATGGFVVGSYRIRGAGSGHFTGDIDEVAVFNGVLKDTAVADVMNTPVERARYRLNESAGSFAADSTGGQAAQVHGTGVTWGTAGGHPAALTTGGYVEDSGTAVGGGALAAWSFNDTLADYTANGRDLDHWNATGSTPATYGPGRAGKAVVLDGINQRLYRSTPIVDSTTSFSITARVKLTRDDGAFAVASQDGSRTVPFLLHYSPAEKRWAFTMTAADQDNPVVHTVLAKHRQVLNNWADLLAVYDAEADMMRFYVGGVLQGEKSFSTPWRSHGSFTVGRTLWNGAQGRFFPGAFDEVRVYGRALTATDAHTMWNLGSSVSAPVLPEFRSESSFTISAWVRSSATPTGGARAALSLDPEGNYSPMILGYRHEWDRFGVLATVEAEDGTTRGFWVLSDKTAAEDADVNGWAHLTVVYDAPRKRVKLFVNGLPQSTVPDGTSTKKATYAGHDITMTDRGRNLVAGRAVWHGITTDFWTGALRDVRMFSGTLPTSCDTAPWCTSQLPVQ